MRIGIYDPYTDALGGGEKYMYTLAECLSQDNDVTLFWDKKQDIDAIERRFSISLQKTRITQNIFSTRISTRRRIQEAGRYDRIVYLSDGSVPTLLRRNLILHFQFPVEWVNPALQTRIKFAQVRKVICNSHFTKRYIDKTFSIRSQVLYPPVEIKAVTVKKEDCILHVGRFAGTNIEGTDYKKQQVMVELFKDMVDKGFKDWRLIIAAGVKDEDKERFIRMKRSALDYPIEFLENETNSALWSIYSKAKIYWHASGFGENLKVNPELAEHFGISTVEAMGAGCVPVVINAGGQKEIVTDGINGMLWDTKEEWVKKTRELSNNEKLFHTLSSAATERAKDFSKEVFSKKAHELLL